MPHFAPLAVTAPHEPALALIHAEPHARPDDPAATIFTDLRVAPSVIVPAAEPLLSALRLMQLAGVRMAFVVDPHQAVIGLVTAADLQGELPTRVALSRQATQRELDVADVMTPLSQWPTVEASVLGRARVGDVVATFRATGQRYLIVVEDAAWPADGAPRRVVRGVFSANRAERALGHAIDVEPRPRSLAELAQALAHA